MECQSFCDMNRSLTYHEAISPEKPLTPSLNRADSEDEDEVRTRMEIPGAPAAANALANLPPRTTGTLGRLSLNDKHVSSGRWDDLSSLNAD